MAITDPVFLAILAMDAYNRGFVGFLDIADSMTVEWLGPNDLGARFGPDS
jgi:hypothetical protein